MIEGIDISHWQRGIDLDAVRAAGYAFVIAKATDGVGDPDPAFVNHIREIKNAGLIAGAYHYARPGSVGSVPDAIAEARDFCMQVRLAGGLGERFVPPAVDFEEYGPNSPKQNALWLRAWVDVAEEELGCTPMIYTGHNVWRYELGNTRDFDALPLWLAAYSKSDSLPMNKTINGRIPDMWQWSGGGQFGFGPRIQGKRVDLNRYTGAQPWDEFITPRVYSC